MNTGNMRLFVSVYETRSIARVAKDMFLSHQAVSKRIAAIESELGATLFVRTGGAGGGVAPTKAGQEVYKSLKAIVSTYDSMTEALAAASHETETLRIAVEFYDAGIFNAAKIFEFDEVAQGRVSVDVKYCTNDDCCYRLMNDQIDMAIANAPLLRRQEFDIYRITDSPTVIMMGANNPLAKKDVLSLADLEGQTSLGIVGCEWTTRYIREAFAKEGLSYKTESVSFTTDSLVSLLSSGRNYHIAPRSFACNFEGNADVAVKPLDSSIDIFELGVFLYRKRPFRLHVESFVKWFLENVDSIISDKA